MNTTAGICSTRTRYVDSSSGNAVSVSSRSCLWLLDPSGQAGDGLLLRNMDASSARTASASTILTGWSGADSGDVLFHIAFKRGLGISCLNFITLRCSLLNTRSQTDIVRVLKFFSAYAATPVLCSATLA
jgi:hypothetical protein